MHSVALDKLYCVAAYPPRVAIVTVGVASTYPPPQVPLIIFKREKEIARRLELKQMWVVEEATSLRDQWDRLVVTSQSFPRNYFDKQVRNL